MGWTGGGGWGGGGGGGQLPKKLLRKEKALKNTMQSDSRKRNREQINGKNCVAQKNCPTPEVNSIFFDGVGGDFHFAGIFFPAHCLCRIFFSAKPSARILVDKHYFLTFPSFLTAYMWITCSKGHSCTFLISMNCFVDGTCFLACFDCICINPLCCGF